MTETNRLDAEASIGNETPTDQPRADFRSILFLADEPQLPVDQPECFPDLNLDHVVAAIVAGREEYALTPFFHTPLRSAEEVVYRQDVFSDAGDDTLRQAVDAFAREMRTVRAYLGLVEKQRYPLEKQRWLLDSVLTYRAAVRAFADALVELDLRSHGMRSLSDYLQSYATSRGFEALTGEAERVAAGLDAVRYTVRIKGGRVTVVAYAGEEDYTVQVEETFRRFREAGAESHLIKVADPGAMGHVDAQIADRVAQLFPDEFGALAEFCMRHGGFLDPVIARFDREGQFYTAYLDHIHRFGDQPTSYPTLADEWGATLVEEGWDVALAGSSRSDASGRIVRNGFSLRERERILVVTGPNQGGKTTFARMIGQLHYLTSLGVPVPARRATLRLTDGVFTVFGQREDIATLRGRLDDELVRLRVIVNHATDHSLILLNEVFASTAVADAVFLGREVLGRITRLGCAAVWVTFVDELASFGEQTVSMVAGVEPDDPTKRTFTITRRPADGRAYAAAIAEKYGLSYEALKRPG